jgi:hypothetical protein
MQLSEIEDNIVSRRNRIFLLMEEVRRLRIQRRLKVKAPAQVPLSSAIETETSCIQKPPPRCLFCGTSGTEGMLLLFDCPHLEGHSR